MNAIATKDHLLQMLQVDDQDQLLINVTQVLTALELTVGIWADLSYAYKGVEIAQRAIDVIKSLAAESSHHKRLGMLNAKLEKAWRVQNLYYAAQYRQRLAAS